MRYFQTNVSSAMNIRVDLHHHHTDWKYVKHDVFIVVKMLLEIDPHSKGAMMPSDSRIMRNLSRWLSEAWIRSLEYKRPTQHSHVIANLNTGMTIILTLNDVIDREEAATADYCWAALQNLATVRSLGDEERNAEDKLSIERQAEIGRKLRLKLDSI